LLNSSRTGNSAKGGEEPFAANRLDVRNCADCTLGGVVTPDGLAGGYAALNRALEVVETDFTPVVTTVGELHIGKRGFYPNFPKSARQTQFAT
jgi:aminopeptidase-like protein